MSSCEGESCEGDKDVERVGTGLKALIWPPDLL